MGRKIRGKNRSGPAIARPDRVRSRGLEPPRVAPLVPETSASAISPRPRGTESVEHERIWFNLPNGSASRLAGPVDGRELLRDFVCRNAIEPPFPLMAAGKNAGRARGASSPCLRYANGPEGCPTAGDRPGGSGCSLAAPRARGIRTAPTRWSACPACGRLCCVSDTPPAAEGGWRVDHSSSSPSSSFGAGPFLAVPSLAAMRFSMTRWRISANIAGFSLMNALAFSRPCPMRVVL